MSMSKVFAHRTNASRAARKAGLLKAPILAVSGGYQFEIPSESPAQFEAGPDECETGIALTKAIEATIAEDEPTDAELSAGRADHTIVNGGIPKHDLAAQVAQFGADSLLPRTEATAVKATRKRQAKAPKAVKPAKAPKVAKPAKAPKAPRKSTAKSTGTAKRGTPEYAAVMAARRTSQGRRGVMDATVALLRRKWVGAAELMQMNEWQSSTLRGLLSLEKKKQGFNLKSRKVDGATEYHIGS